MKVFIETGTVDHVLCVEAEPADYVTIVQYEGSCRHGKYETLLRRFKLAWRVLRGEGYTWEEFYSPESVDKLVVELARARKVAFGQSRAEPCSLSELQYRIDLLQGWKKDHLSRCPEAEKL